MAQNNIACRIFKEQIDLIQQLPENERAVVLYSAIMQAFNQFDNQNENQNECAYVSVSVSISVLGKCILDLLSKNIAFKEFSSNYGGKREGAGKSLKQNIPDTNPSRIPTRDKDGDKDIVKERKKIVFIPPTLEEWLAFCKENTLDPDKMTNVFNGYSVANWHDSQGKKLKSWKQKILMVWNKPENKEIPFRI